jgi:hypothetical protein
MEPVRNAYKILVGKPERKRPRFTWEDNITMYLREIGSEVLPGFIRVRTGTSGRKVENLTS